MGIRLHRPEIGCIEREIMVRYRAERSRRARGAAALAETSGGLGILIRFRTLTTRLLSVPQISFRAVVTLTTAMSTSSGPTQILTQEVQNTSDFHAMTTFEPSFLG
jgi:hypothetical protein